MWNQYFLTIICQTDFQAVFGSVSFSLPAAIVGLTSSNAASSYSILFTSGTAGDTIFYGLAVLFSDLA